MPDDPKMQLPAEDEELEAVMPIRDFNVSTVVFDADNKPQSSDELEFGLALQELIDEKPTRQLTLCVFGFAEEVIFLLARADGTFDVGIGESMRPTQVKYQGTDKDDAKTEFVDILLNLTQLNEFESE